MRRLISIILIFFVLSAVAIHPTELNDDDFSNSLSASVAAPVLADPNSLKDDPGRLTGGRERKAREASGNGLAGGIVATAIGGTLITVGLGMMASPDLTTQIAGADLVGKGGQELAQGISNIASSGDNKSQENKLLQSDPASSSRPALPSIPELDRVLEEKKIDPESFKEKLVSGELSQPEEILKALDQTVEISEEMKEQASLLANEKLQEVLSESASAPEKVTIQYQETSPASATFSIRFPEAQAKGGLAMPGTPGVAPALSSKPVKEPSPRKKESTTESLPESRSTWDELTALMLGNHPSATNPTPSYSLLSQIKPKAKSENIFDVAYRAYRDFSMKNQYFASR